MVPRTLAITETDGPKKRPTVNSIATILLAQTTYDVAGVTMFLLL
jgi:hypothetical protein